MKIAKLIFSFALGLALTAAQAQNLAPDQNAKGKWGFVDESGRAVIDYKYDEAEGFVKGRAKVKKGNNYGYINEKGKTVVPIKYQELTPFDAYSYRAATDGKVKDGVLLDEKWGFIDLDGKPLLKCEYQEVGEFGSNGLAYVCKDGKYGYINRRFEFVVPCKFTAVGAWNKDGRVWVCEGGKADKNNPSQIVGGKLGIYDENGSIIIPVKFASLGTFTYDEYPDEVLRQLSIVERTYAATLALGHKRENKVPVEVTKFSSTPVCGDMGYFYSNNSNTYKNGVADANGKELIKPGAYQIAWYPSENLAVVLKSNKINFLNLTSGKLMAKKGYANAFSFVDGYAVIQPAQNSGWKLIDTSFHDATPEYTHIFPYADKCYRVVTSKGMGLISSTGKTLIEPSLAFIGESNNQRMKFRETADGKSGYIDNTGTRVIAADYDDASDFENGMAKVKVGDNWGVIDTNGKQRLAPLWSVVGDIVSPDQKEFWVGSHTDNLMHLYSTETNGFVFGNGFYGARAFDVDIPGAAIVTGAEAGTIGCIDRTGKIIIPNEFDEISQVVEAHSLLSKRPAGATWQQIDTYRLKQRHNPKLNKGKLSETLSSDLWDY